MNFVRPKFISIVAVMRILQEQKLVVPNLAFLPLSGSLVLYYMVHRNSMLNCPPHVKMIATRSKLK